MNKSNKFFQEGDQEEEDNGSENMVILKYYHVESRAQLASAFLRQNGIPNFLSNTFMNQILPLQMGSIALHVKSKDVDDAKLLLNEFDGDDLADFEDVIVDLDHGVIRVREHKLKKKVFNNWVLIFIVILIIALLIHTVIRWEDGFKFW